MKDGIYITKTDSAARRADSVYIDQEALELARLNARTKRRRDAAMEERQREQLAILEKRQQAQKARQRREQKTRKRLGRVTLCTGSAAVCAVCAVAGLMSWAVAAPVMLLCAVAAGFALGR